MKTTCILIGTSHYASDKIPKIPLCQNDLKNVSETFANHLSISYSDIHTVGMDNPEAAKRSNILRLISNAPALSNDADCLIIYYTGHGVSVGGESYFLAYDSEPDLLSDTAIPVERIRKQFSEVTAQNKLFIIDSCFSGVTFGKALDCASNFSKSLDSLTGTGWTILSSCKGDEYSWFYDEKKMSVFTYFLIEGFKGNALRPPETNNLPFEDLYLFVSRKVAEWAVNSGRSQTPTIRGEKAGTLVFKLTNPTAPSSPSAMKVDTTPKAVTVSLTSNYVVEKGHSVNWAVLSMLPITRFNASLQQQNPPEPEYIT